MTRITVLVVMREPVCARVLTEMLHKLDLHVLPAVSSSGEALQAVLENKVDLVFMGITLVGQPNGIETAKMFRASGGPHVVFVTAYDTPDIMTKALEARPLAYFVKPIMAYEIEEFLIGLKL